MSTQLSKIEEAVEDIRNGKIVIVVDDEDRENEGDFVAAAEKCTPEMINFMAKYGRGLICAPITESRARELELDLMVGKNTDPLQTAFTISVDYKGAGNTTGISAQDRANTVRALIDPATLPDDLARPGHIFPLKARKGGVLRRTGHTEAAIDLARLAGLEPAGVIVEIMNEDGTMARLPQLAEIARKFDVKIISIEDLISYRMEKESLIEREDVTEIVSGSDRYQLHIYRQTTTDEKHLALTKGSWNSDDPVPVRVHSSFLSGDIFNSCECSAGPALFAAIKKMGTLSTGVLLYMQQENNTPNLGDTIRREGIDAIDAKLRKMKLDPRDYGVGAQILRDLGVRKMRLLSNNKVKRTGIVGYGLEVVDYISPD